MKQSDADAGVSAAEQLMIHRDAIAREVTALLYAECPELIDRYGERGREKTLQDMRHNIDHLIPAVDLGDVPMYARYVQWLDGVLRARDVSTYYVLRCYELLMDRCDALFASEAARAVRDIVQPSIQGLRS